MTSAPPRSWLFVPADSEKKIARALDCGADAIIFDLEDSVAPSEKPRARDMVKTLAASDRSQLWVRINPLTSQWHKDDLDILANSAVYGIVLPKSEGGADVETLAHRTGSIPIHAIVTETAASLFGLLSYRGQNALSAMSWGAEDLSADLGASSKYDEDGGLSFTYRMARSLCLAGAKAAGVCAVDTVFTDFRDEPGLILEALAAAREGFDGKLAIHPAQVAPINEAFSPTAEDVHHAQAVVDAFAAQPDAGVLSIDGRMIDRPHLLQAQRVLARSDLSLKD
ncbi:CoA ester lyase [Sphingomonas sp. KRR8]|uniref:HpcH/HpaI aldolase/citrate lyase family protein n=1 Tax=Sphingomonas sp. KRR8 TaxID=2942996 RepID=UPI002020FD2B|nr:CoA ester lyase [Sphingomonas sp. KRR8]URD60822.1 CoA ester lyase [Sphingomonas sp. KRR8]